MKSQSKSPETLLQRIRAIFPDLVWDSYRYIDEGWDHEVLILDQKLVFRFPNDDEYFKQLYGETQALKRLKTFVSVQIPDYTYIAPDHSFAGYPYIPGQPLHRDLFDSLRPDARKLIAEQLASLLSAMHQLVGQGHDFTLVMPSDMKEQQARIKTQAKQYLPAVLSAEDFATIKDIMAETDRLLALTLPTVLIHGDIYNNHLLWDEVTKQLGAIDFSDMNLGDPAFDFAELYEYGESFVQEVYSYYTAPKDATFLSRAWTYQRWVAVFMLVDHFISNKTSFAIARETFDRVKPQ